MTFFDKYSYKQKNYVLLVLIVLLSAVAWKRAFSTTFISRNVRAELQSKLERAASADTEIRSKYAELATLNRYLGEENNSVEKVQQAFLNFFASKAEGINVYQIEEVLNYQHPDFEINTHRIVLKGNYLNTLQFLYEFEKQFTLAKLLSVKFEYKRYSTDDEKDLFTVLLIQNYIR